MTQYSKQDLETRFKGAGSIRKRDSKYSSDGGYWDGGRCEWGGAHNLAEDCEKLANLFAGIAELRNARQELMKFNNRDEFEKNKQKLLVETNQAISNLNMKTGNTTSIGGVCIIWDDFSHFFGPIINDFRNEVERLKTNIEKVPYNEAKELQKLLIEERKLKREIEENERRANKELDETKKKQFLFLADQAKKKWKNLLDKKQQLKTARLGDNFNPEQHIDNFLKELEDRLSGKNRPIRPQRTPNQPSPSNDSDNPTNPDIPPTNPYSNYPNSTANNQPKSFLQEYWREIVLVGGLALGAYYILNQPKEHE